LPRTVRPPIYRWLVCQFSETNFLFLLRAYVSSDQRILLSPNWLESRSLPLGGVFDLSSPLGPVKTIGSFWPARSRNSFSLFLFFHDFLRDLAISREGVSSATPPVFPFSCRKCRESNRCQRLFICGLLPVRARAEDLNGAGFFIFFLFMVGIFSYS